MKNGVSKSEEQRKYRHEYKYICTDSQIVDIKNRLSNLIKIDSHIVEEDMYNVRSLYLDDYYNTNFYENESGVEPREKIRIRMYNNDDSRINLEIKKKSHSKTYKETTIISKDIAEDIISNRLKYNENYDKILKKVWLLKKCRLLKPVIIVDYNRIPYVCSNGNTRITIDKNISSSRYIDKFFDKDMPKRPINKIGNHILEIKFDEYLPDYIYKSLQINGLIETEYSKYYLCRKYSL